MEYARRGSLDIKSPCDLGIWTSIGELEDPGIDRVRLLQRLDDTRDCPFEYFIVRDDNNSIIPSLNVARDTWQAGFVKVVVAKRPCYEGMSATPMVSELKCCC